MSKNERFNVKHVLRKSFILSKIVELSKLNIIKQYIEFIILSIIWQKTSEIKKKTRRKRTNKKRRNVKKEKQTKLKKD